MNTNDINDFKVALKHRCGGETFCEIDFPETTYEEVRDVVMSDGLGEKDWSLAIVWERDNRGEFAEEAAHIFKNGNEIYSS